MNIKKWTITLISICCAIFCMGCNEDLHVSEMPETESNVDSQNASEFLEPNFVTKSSDVFEGKEFDYSSFKATLSLNGKDYGIEFEWTVAGNKIFLSMPDDWPENFGMETIPGSKGSALLQVTEKQGYIQDVFMCDLENSQVVDIMPESVFGDSVYDVDVSPDLKHMLIQTDNTVFYYDGKNVVDLSVVCEKSSEGRLVGVLLDDSVLLSVYTDRQEQNTTQFYAYDLTQQKVSFIAELQTTEIKRYGDQYATEIRDGQLGIWDLLKGEYTETVITEDKLKNLLNVNENYFLVVTMEHRLCLIDKDSAKIRYISEKKVDFSDAKAWGIVVDEQGEYFLQVVKPGKVEYYNIR